MKNFAFSALCLVTVAASAAAGVLMLDGASTGAGVTATFPSGSSEAVMQVKIAVPAVVSNIALRRDRDAVPDEQTVAEGSAPQSPVEIAYVQPHILPLLPSISDQRETAAADAAQDFEDWSDDWATETRADTAKANAGPRIARAAIERLPWKSKAADGPQRPNFSLKERVSQIAPGARRRLVAKFLSSGAAFPPSEIGLVAIKDRKTIELHARAGSGEWKLVHEYKVLAASGGAGPKLAQGDRQVPEGVYGISFLNPNSLYHVALRVDYPNAFDRKMAAKDGRKQLGGDIMIHGKNLSRGCLAIGDEAAEELFVLAEMIGLKNVKLVIAPTDFRQTGVPEMAAGKPKWLPELYAEVATAMAPFKAPPSVGLLSLFGI